MLSKGVAHCAICGVLAQTSVKCRGPGVTAAPSRVIKVITRQINSSPASSSLGPALNRKDQIVNLRSESEYYNYDWAGSSDCCGYHVAEKCCKNSLHGL